MKKILALTALAGATFLSAPAFAADPPMHYAKDYSWYLELRVGAPIPVDHAFVVTGGAPAGDYKPDTGFHGAVSVGKYLNDNWRGEVSLSITRGEDGEAVLVGGAVLPHAGSVNVITLLGSVLYDFNTSGSWTPFVGAGLGFAVVDFNNLGAIGGGFTVTGSDVVFAGALHAGVSIPLSDRTDLTGRYTLGVLGGGDFDTTLVGISNSTSTEVEHLFTIGVRFKLN